MSFLFYIVTKVKTEYNATFVYELLQKQNCRVFIWPPLCRQNQVLMYRAKV